VRASISPVDMLDSQNIGHDFLALQDEPTVSVSVSNMYVGGTANAWSV
jgi:hypothetical protein